MLYSPDVCFNPLKRVYAFLTGAIAWIVGSLLECFNPLKRVYAFLTVDTQFKEKFGVKFQSPKTGLCFSHKDKR